MSTPTRPHTTVILAMSVDGKIAVARRSPPKFSSDADQAHLEAQVAQADGVLFGATTLRAGGTAMRVKTPELIQQRQQQGKPEQPVQIVCSRSAEIDPNLKFFDQPIPRWLLTTPKSAERWQSQSGFDQILAYETETLEIDWAAAFEHFAASGLAKIAVLGGGELIASLLAADYIDELWLTVCPVILGGTDAPTPIGGEGFLQDQAPRLELLEVKPQDQELFLHYRLRRSQP